MTTTSNRTAREWNFLATHVEKSSEDDSEVQESVSTDFLIHPAGEFHSPAGCQTFATPPSKGLERNELGVWALADTLRYGR